MLINSKNGAILPVTIVAMTIMMIIGLVCLQMFHAQNILITHDQVKLRTFYSAEGAVNIVRGFIDFVVEEKKNKVLLKNGKFVYSDDHLGGKGYLYMKTNGKDWYPLETADDYPIFVSTKCFDGTMYPAINCRVYCARIVKPSNLASYGITFPYVTDSGDNDNYAYKIVAIASATHKTNLSTRIIVSTVTYYFCTKRIVEKVDEKEAIEHKRYFVCWRKD